MSDMRRLAVRRDRGTRAVEAITAALSAGAVVATGALATGMAVPVSHAQPAQQHATATPTTARAPQPAAPRLLPPPRQPAAAPAQSGWTRPAPASSTGQPSPSPIPTQPPPTTAAASTTPAPAPTTSAGS